MDMNAQFSAHFPAELSFADRCIANGPLNLNFQGLASKCNLASLKEEEGLSESDKIYPSASDTADDQSREDPSSPTEKLDRGQKQSKPFVCESCGQAFSQISNLKRHERLHTGEKPYACEVCKKTFSTQSNLKQHHQTHENTNERAKFECQRCNKSYFYQSSLNKHMKSHDKTDSRMEFEKDSRSLSPRKGAAPTLLQIPKQDSPNWEASEEVFSDVSPTSKRIKKENVKIGQLSPTTTSETNNGSQASRSEKVEEEFIAQYNKNLAKVLNQTANSFDLNPMNSLLNLQYLSLADPQPMLFQNSGYTAASALAIQSNQTDFMKLFPGHQFATGGYQPGLFGPQHNSQPLQSESYEPYTPLYNLFGQEIFQKPRNGTLEHQQRNSVESIGQQSLFSFEIVDKEQVPTENVNNESGINTKSEFQENSVLNANLMEGFAGLADYELERIRDSRRRSSLEGEFGGYLFSDRLFGFGLQRESSDSNAFVKEEGLANGGSLDFFH